MILNIKKLSEKSAEELLVLFREAAFEHGQATLSGNYKIANKACDVIDAVYEEMKTRNIVEEVLVKLLSDRDISVKSWTASHLLPFIPEQAENVLKEISASEKSILGFNAEMVLKQWKKGELYFKS